ncbi:MAG: hypothetical protein ACHQ50_07660 [Fimbriimonadales bacterium]
MARKTAIVLLGHPPADKQRPRGKPAKRYGPDVLAALEMLWAVSGYICSKRLVPGLPHLVAMMRAHKESMWSAATEAKLLTLSPATCDRLLKASRKAFAPKGRSLTKPGTLLKSQIAIRTWDDWAETEPGYCEGDLVHHCDNDTSGEYLHTLTLTDVLLGWTENEALPNRSEQAVKNAVESLRARMPYPVKGLDFDCGGEFINDIMFRYCKDQRILFTRARPGKKNDQCRVEQKNWTVVRQNVGYNRFEGEDARRALSAFYRVLRLQVNFVQPSMRLVSKERVGARIRKTYDQAKTPCQRALEHPCVSEETKEALTQQLASVNPAQIAREIVRLRAELYKHAK